jgi:hypothetical protein
MSRTKMANSSRGLEALFSTPSLMNGEDGEVYAQLYARVEELAQPKDVWDQMMVSDVVNHFWEQQRYRRCTGVIINSKRREALRKILRNGIGLNSEDAQTVADIYFGVRRYEEEEFGGIRYSDPAQIPKTRPGVVNFLKKHGFDESDIDRLAMEIAVDTLADLEDLALKHEIRREAIFRELERRRDRRHEEQQTAGRSRLNGKVRALARDLPEAPSTSATEAPP